MKGIRLLKDKSGASMIFAIVLFLILTVFGMNLLNAVNANVLDTGKEIQKEQTLLYITSTADIVNQMICEGKFLDTFGKMPANAKASFATKGEAVSVELLFVSKASSLQADIIMKYKSQEYKIKNYYTKVGTTYRLERCYGLEGA